MKHFAVAHFLDKSRRHMILWLGSRMAMESKLEHRGWLRTNAPYEILSFQPFSSEDDMRHAFRELKAEIVKQNIGFQVERH